MSPTHFQPRRPPAHVGTPVDEVETPALLVDLDAYEANLGRMTASMAGMPARLRPHAKTHRSPIVARHQVERGAVGVCCQTLGEAEAMVDGGIADVLITNQVATPGKIRRLVALARHADVKACVDDPANALDLAAAASAAGVVLPLLVEVDIGQGRCGVRPGEEALRLARLVDAAPSLRFDGLQAYHGGLQHVYAQGERDAAALAAIDLTRATVDLLRRAGLDPRIVGGGGTGSYEREAASGVYNEVQAGSYVFMDADYRRVDGPPRRFDNALFVVSTIVSARDGRCVCDAGLKASSTDSGLPVVWGREGLSYVGASDEHGTIHVDGPAPRVGERLRLVPGHCDPTVNLHDWLVAVRGDRVEALWPITGRGAHL